MIIDRTKAVALAVFGISAVLITGVTAVRTDDTTAPQQQQRAPRRQLASLSHLPLYFVQNRGQLDSSVDYYLPGHTRDVYFTSEGVTFALTRRERLRPESTPDRAARFHPARWDSRSRLEIAVQRWAVKLDFVGADPEVRPVGRDRGKAVISYFKGNLGTNNTTGIPTHRSLAYQGLWPGIDLEYTVASHQLKYTFTVAPGADPDQIRLAFRSAEVTLNRDGQLLVSTPVGSFVDDPPYVYQRVGATRIDVPAGYALEEAEPGEAQVVTFRLGPYDPNLPLVVDPMTPIYAGYVGGDQVDDALDIAVDADGNAYLTGRTKSLEGSFPVEGGPDPTFNGDQDAFVAKVDPTGTQLLFAGYIGGSENEEAFGITLDADRNVFIVGNTSSPNFPATVGPDLTFNGGVADAFVAKIRADGEALVYAGFIGGDANDRGIGIEVLSDGTAIIAGTTDSTETTFPTTGGPDLSHNGADDTFVTQVRPDGTGLVTSGFVGGAGFDISQDVSVDRDGNAYIIGSTNSDQITFPVLNGPDLTYNGGIRDVFIVKVGADDMAIDYAGYIGGSGDDQGLAIDVDERGYAYFAGNTDSTEANGFPLAVGPDLTHNGDLDVFVGALNAEGTDLVFNGYIGGEARDFTSHLALDGQRAVWLSGGTRSPDFPTPNGFDDSFNGGALDGYAAKVALDGSALIAASFVGGAGFDTAGSIAVDPVGNAYISGATGSTEDSFPVSVGPDLTHNGITDGFVMKLRCQASHEVSGVFEAAGFQALISPGSVVSVFGDFVDTTATASSIPLRENLNGFSVTFNDIPGALFGVFDGAFDQSNVQVPWNVDVSSGKVEVKVHWEDEGGGVWSEPFEVDAGLASPGIYMFPPGTTRAIVTNFKLSEDDDVIAGSWAQAPGSVDPVVGRPAAIGGVVTIWCNGLGPVGPLPATGDIPPPGTVPVTDKTVRVFVGDVEAQVLGAVLQPSNVGLNQINIFIPEGVTPGNEVPIVIEVDCGDGKVFRSREDVTIAVRAAP